MHPLISRYLDPARALGVLTDNKRGVDVAAEDRHLVAISGDFPDERDLLLSSGPHLDEDVQRVVLFLATHAAVRALAEDPELGPATERARARLIEAGAQPSEAKAFIAEVVAEEAFGVEEEPDTFDRAWLLESLELLPKLAALDEEIVTSLIGDYARTTEPGTGTALLRERAARALLEAAWADGASPVNVEHVEEALDDLYGEVGEDEFPDAAAALRGFIAQLEARGFAGPLRAGRLRKAIDRAAHAGEGADEDDDLLGLEDEELEDAELAEPGEDVPEPDAEKS